MKSELKLALVISLLPVVTSAAQSMYCPGNHGYINVGMSADEVLAACGAPISKKQGNRAVVEKIPVTQLIYTTLNQGAVYMGLNSVYSMWSLPSGSTGLSLSVDVIDNKVRGININGSATNAASICGGTSIQIGDDVNTVYSACGNPSMVNNTYINKAVPNSSKPEVWIYQVNQYQPLFSLTFINGQLQSID